MNSIKTLTMKTKQWHWIWAVVGSLMMWVAIGVFSRNFNLSSLAANLASASFLTLSALGQMIVMTTGRGAIDLSIPNVITLGAFLTMGLTGGKDSRFLPVLVIVLIVGAIVGILNSLLVVWMKITPMVATLAVGYIVSSIISFYNRDFNTLVVCNVLKMAVTKKILGLPLICYLVIGITILIYLLFRRVTYGRALLALGQNKKAAALSGIRVIRVETLAYVMSGMLAALTGVFLSARVGGAFLGMGDTYMLDTVGSVVVGGTLAMGGRAVPAGTLFGALFFSLLVTAMQVANFSIGVQYIVKGVLIILVLVLSTNKSDA